MIEDQGTGQVPLYPVQLRDVIVWELNTRRGVQTTEVQGSDQASMSWKVETSPLNAQVNAQFTGYVGKLTLEYRYPEQGEPAYEIHVELVGIFEQHTDAGTKGEMSNSSAEEVEQTPQDVATDEHLLIPIDQLVTTLLWPYLREFMHQLQLRMRVRPVLLPTLAIALGQPSSDQKPSA